MKRLSSPIASTKPHQRRAPRRLGRDLAVLSVLAVLAAVAIVGWYKLFRVVNVEYASEEDHFKYGSTGTEDQAGVPFYVWKALPRICPDLLPGPNGYASLGMNYEPGRDFPIGMSVKTIGFPRIAVNCALCHSGSVRETEDGRRHVVLAAGANRLDAQGYMRFLFGCVSDPRFEPGNVLEAMSHDGAPLSTTDKLLYRFLVIPQTKAALLKQRSEYSTWMDAVVRPENTRRPRWAHGRIEPFNPVKFHMLKLPVDQTIGVSDAMPLWKMTTKTGSFYHWDGLLTDLTETAYAGALGDGATTKSINTKNLDRLVKWIATVSPPPYPFPIDQARAEAGKQIFHSAGCADCHSPSGKRFRTLIPVDEPGLRTDRHRVDMWTEEARDIYTHFADDKPWAFKHFNKGNGYVAVPLDGLWLRGPYLHNGSVPTLHHLFHPEERPVRFFRGSDVLERTKVGFVYELPADRAKAEAFLRETTEIDTTVPGNGNRGHTYGTDLSHEDKAALIEYMKTL